MDTVKRVANSPRWASLRQVMRRRMVVPVWLVLLGVGLVVLLSGLMSVSAHPPTTIPTCSSLGVTTDKDNYLASENITVHVHFDPGLPSCNSPSSPSTAQHIVVVDVNGAIVTSWSTNSSIERTVSWNPGLVSRGYEVTVRACVTGPTSGWEDCASKNVLVGTGWTVSPTNLAVGAGAIGLGLLVLGMTAGAFALGRGYSMARFPFRKLNREPEKPKV